MNLKEIRDIINLMNEHDLTEIEIEREGMKIKLKKGSNGMEVSHSSIPQIHVEAQRQPDEGDKAKPAEDDHRKEVISPMVGTFYRSPTPESPPFVEVGQTVEVGEVVCIVEAMKLMNEIKSEVKGKIVEVLVENAQPVEFGQTLFLVEPA